MLPARIGLFAGLAVAAASQVPARAVPPGAGVVAGHVIDAITRKPLSDVQLNLSVREPSVGFRSDLTQRQVTKDDGLFRFEKLGPIQFSLDASRAAYWDSGYGVRRAAGTSAVLKLDQDEIVDNIVVLMWPFSEIRGTVVDDLGEPVAGVSVHAGAGASRPFVSSSANTDGTGTYRLRVHAGRYTVCVEPRYSSLPILPSTAGGGIESGPGRPTAGVRITQFGSAVPHLIDADGRTLLDIEAGLTPPPPGPDGRLSAFTATCAPSATTRQDARVVDVPVAGSVGHVDIALQLRAAARIAGRLLGSTGPIGNALISLAGLDDSGIPIAAALTDPLGAFTFVIAPAGTRKITGRVMDPPAKVTASPTGMPTVYYPDYGMGDGGGFWFASPLVIGDRSVSDVVLAALPGRTVTGRLESDRSGPGAAPGVQGAMVRLQNAEMSSDMFGGPSASAASGSFTLTGVRPGSYIVDATAGGWTVASITRDGADIFGMPIDVGPSGLSGIEVVLTTKMTEVSGVVRDAQSHVVRDATVVIFPVSPAQRISIERSNVNRVRTARAISGRYNFSTLPFGDYFVVALDDSMMAPWPDRAFIASLESHATRVTVALGEQKTVDLVMSVLDKR